MACEEYESHRFTAESMGRIDLINKIIEEYVAQGFILTVRQLYYQLVARDIIPNNEKSYKSTTKLVSVARVAGLIDWDAIEDRTRSFIARQRWETPRQIFDAAINGFHTDPWDLQKRRVFLFVEKEALVGVFQGVCNKYDVPLLAARGYPSASVIREFAKQNVELADKPAVILHFGDHDPSGIDMTRDLRERFELFGWHGPFSLHRLALNYDQIEEYKPPENPAKTADPRFEDYERKFGGSSWELDALPPKVLSDLAETNILDWINLAAWEKWEKSVAKIKRAMTKAVETFK